MTTKCYNNLYSLLGYNSYIYKWGEREKEKITDTASFFTRLQLERKFSQQASLCLLCGFNHSYLVSIKKTKVIPDRPRASN